MALDRRASADEPFSSSEVWLVQTRRILFGATIAAWLVLCVLVLSRLVRRAALAPPATIDEYARAPGFQVLDFVVGYLPKLVLLLGLLLGLEYVALRLANRWRSRARSRSMAGQHGTFRS